MHEIGNMSSTSSTVFPVISDGSFGVAATDVLTVDVVLQGQADNKVLKITFQ